MLLFLNIDCVLAPPADALGPSFHGHTGLRRLEAVLNAWPQLRVVMTSDRRYRMTLAHFRAFFSQDVRHRVVAATKLYPLDGRKVGRTREDEVLDFLSGFACDVRAWLVLDRYGGDYLRHADRLVCCTTLTADVVAALHAVLQRSAPVDDPASQALADGHAAGNRPVPVPPLRCGRQRHPGVTRPPQNPARRADAARQTHVACWTALSSSRTE